MTTDIHAPETDDPTPALGTIVEEGRGALPFALIHGEALVACAAWALGDAGVTAVDLGTAWAGLADSGEPFVLHDALCPMTPASFIADCLMRSAQTGAAVAGVDEHGTVLSPVVLPPAVVAGLEGLPSLDFEILVAAVEDRFPVERITAPASAGRVAGPDDVAALEALTTPEPA